MRKWIRVVSIAVSAALLCLLVLNSSSLFAGTSNTYIKAGQTFMLGGEQSLPVTVEAATMAMLMCRCC